MPGATVTSTGPLVEVERIRGVVQAVFTTSLYLAPPSGPLLVFHDSAHGHTPTSLLIPHARPGQWGAKPGDGVVSRLGMLRVGAVLLDARHARRWCPQSLKPPQGVIHIAALKARLGRKNEPLSQACRALTTALAHDRSGNVMSACRALVGTGPGLTPSGDDALIGLLAVLHRIGAPKCDAGPLRLLQATLRPLLIRTSPISAHYLGLACDGHFGENLANLVDSLATGRDVPVTILDRVMATGATSGADMLVGLLAGVELLGELEATHTGKDAA